MIIRFAKDDRVWITSDEYVGPARVVHCPEAISIERRGSSQHQWETKGGSFLSSRMVYAPYIPMQTTPTIDLDDFDISKPIAERYAKKKVDPSFYGRAGYTSHIKPHYFVELPVTIKGGVEHMMIEESKMEAV